MPGSGIDKIKKDLQDEYINEKTKLKNTNYGPAIVYQKNEKIVPARVRKMMTGGDGTAYYGEEVIDEKFGEYVKSAGKFLKNKALPALSKTPIAAKLGFPIAAAILGVRALSNSRKSTLDKIKDKKTEIKNKKIEQDVDKYVKDRKIVGGPKKIDASPYNAPHHVDYMKTERPKREPIKAKTREQLGLRGVNAKVRPVKEATMTPAQKRKDTMLKKKYEKSDDMMKSFKDQYGKEKGEKVFYAYIRKKSMSMEEENIQEVLDKKDVPFIKKLVKALKDGSNTHLGQSKKLAKALKEQLGGVGPKVAPSSQEMKKKLTVAKEPLTKQSLEMRKQDQANITSKMNQLGGIETTTSKNGKLDSMSIQSVGSGTNKDALKSVLAKSATGVKMDADGVVPDAGAVVQQQAMKGINIAQNVMSNNPTKFTSTQKQDFNTAKNYAASGQIKTDINRQIPGTQQFRYDIAADEINLASQKNKPKTNKGIKIGMQKEDITDEALTIQDWNVDDIKFTEIETVDIIKAKPLKESMTDKEFMKTDVEMKNNAAAGVAVSQEKQNDYVKEVNRRLKLKNQKKVVSGEQEFKTKEMKIEHYNWRDELDEDWQKVNRKDKTDGLSRKAVKAYRRENPGSKLQTAVTKDPKKLKKGSKSAKRRLSFCRRMKGMKKKLTSAKTRRDPDSRINKALRRWNC